MAFWFRISLQYIKFFYQHEETIEAQTLTILFNFVMYIASGFSTSVWFFFASLDMSIRALNICILYSPSSMVFKAFRPRDSRFRFRRPRQVFIFLENPRDISQAGPKVWGVEGAAPVLAAPAVRVGIGEMSPLATRKRPTEGGQYGCTNPTTTLAVGGLDARGFHTDKLVTCVKSQKIHTHETGKVRILARRNFQERSCSWNLTKRSPYMK